MFLLQHVLPPQPFQRRFTSPEPLAAPPAGRPGDRWTGFEAMASEARAGFPDRLGALVDQDVEMVELTMRDFYDAAPGDQDEDA